MGATPRGSRVPGGLSGGGIRPILSLGGRGPHGPPRAGPRGDGAAANVTSANGRRATPMETCTFCDRNPADAGARLFFRHVRRRQKATLRLKLCPLCADRLEKHLKRMVAKRYFVFSSDPSPEP